MEMTAHVQKFNGKFKGKHFVSVHQFTSADDVEIVFELADKMKKAVEKRTIKSTLEGHCIAELFYQPSTRTFSSFLAAAKWLGAITVPIHGMKAYSSAVKGESLPDSIRTIHQTTACDAVILRHPEDSSSEIASKYSPVPVINAGSGKKEHPTQAVLDLYTIRSRLYRTDSLSIVMCGDLKNGRTVKSLAILLSLVNGSNKITFVSPDSLRAPLELVEGLKDRGVEIAETNNLETVVPEADVLYVTRIQREWFAKKEEYEAVKGAYVVDHKLMRKAKKDMIVMHPLPRLDEISSEVDEDPREAYFGQMRNGLYTRMGLLQLLIKGRGAASSKPRSQSEEDVI